MKSRKRRIVLFSPRSPKYSLRTTPLALLAISSILDREGKYDIKIITADTESNYIQQTVDFSENAICVGITCMTGPSIMDALMVAKKIKERSSNIPIVWGGWHPSILPDQTIMNPFVDIVVRGQGERTFTELVHRLEDNASLQDVLGITYKENGKIVSNPDRPIEDINNFPPLPFHLVDLEKYIKTTDIGSRTVAYISSYGCPHRCGFCADAKVNKRRWTGLKSERVLNDLERLVKDYRIDSVGFLDSNFFVNEERVRQICRGIIDKKLQIKWGTDGRADQLARYKNDTWDLIKASGCAKILVGAESGSQEVLDFITKDATIEDTIEVAKIAVSYRIGLSFTFMLGFPNTPNSFNMPIEEQFERTADLLDKIFSISPNHEAVWFIYTPYPGTPLYELSIKNGLREPTSLEGWSNFELYTMKLPWVPKEYVKMIQFLDGFIFPFSTNFARDTLKNKRIPIPRHLMSFTLKILQKDARFRFKHRLFLVPIEYNLINLLRPLLTNLFSFNENKSSPNAR